MAGWFFFAPVQWMLQQCQQTLVALPLRFISGTAAATGPGAGAKSANTKGKQTPSSKESSSSVPTTATSLPAQTTPFQAAPLGIEHRFDSRVEKLKKEDFVLQGEATGQEDERRRIQKQEEVKSSIPPKPTTAADDDDNRPAAAQDEAASKATLVAPPAASLAPNISSATPTTTTMSSSAESSLRHTLQVLQTSPPTSPQTSQLLRDAKKQLMALNALIPSENTPATALRLARSTLEAGALLSIRAQDPAAFTRYYQQLQPFYDLPGERYQEREDSMSKEGDVEGESQRSKITGLYLLLLLTKGDYAGFHTLLEGLEMESENMGSDGLEVGDRFIRYPVMLEQWLMEGAYDRVWAATRGEGAVPGEEFGVFSEVLIHTIRAEIASCSEKAYPSIPVANAKNLLFLDSEGSVVKFAEERGWLVKDGRIYFPLQQGEGMPRTEKEILVASGQVIENTIGYARELETIV